MPVPVERADESVRRLTVAIDGPAGSGKSTVARGVATALGLRYLDTGAMYRAVTWRALHDHVDVDDGVALGRLVDATALTVSTDPAAQSVTVGLVDVTAGPVDVTAAIRTAEVTAAVSAVSRHPEVRTRLVARQRQLADGGGIVVEGRDIGTVVLPDAPVKVYLTASGEERARRRATEQVSRPSTDELASIRLDLDRRDRTDSTRTASPLARADDAVELDTTGMAVDDVIAVVVDRCRAAVVAASPAAR